MEIDAGAADEAGVLVAFGGMTNEVGRFVDHKDIGVLVDDVEQGIHTALGRSGFRGDVRCAPAHILLSDATGLDGFHEAVHLVPGEA